MYHLDMNVHRKSFLNRSRESRNPLVTGFHSSTKLFKGGKTHEDRN